MNSTEFVKYFQKIENLKFPFEDFLFFENNDESNENKINTCYEIDLDIYEKLSVSKNVKDDFYIVEPIKPNTNCININECDLYYFNYIKNVTDIQNIARKFMFDNKKYWKLITYSESKLNKKQKLIPPFNYSIFEKMIYDQNTISIKQYDDKFDIYSSPIPNSIFGIKKTSYSKCYYVITIQIIKDIDLLNNYQNFDVVIDYIQNNSSVYKMFTINQFNRLFNQICKNIQKYSSPNIFKLFIDNYVLKINSKILRDNSNSKKIKIYVNDSFFIGIIYLKTLCVNNISNILFHNLFKPKNNALSFLTIDSLKIIDEYYRKNIF